jgi:hypothetical protein
MSSLNITGALKANTTASLFEVDYSNLSLVELKKILSFRERFLSKLQDIDRLEKVASQTRLVALQAKKQTLLAEIEFRQIRYDILAKEIADWQDEMLRKLQS